MPLKRDLNTTWSAGLTIAGPGTPFKPLDWQPSEAIFRAIHASLDGMVRFRMVLEPYPDKAWGEKFNLDYPELPLGVESWLRSPGIIEIDCPLDLLKNVKRRLQTHMNEVNIWFEKKVLPPAMKKHEETMQRNDTLAKIVAEANDILDPNPPQDVSYRE